MEEIYVVTTVVDSRSVADELAGTAVTDRLAACAQVGAAEVISTYRWQGSVETATEWPVWFKTAPDRVAALVAYLRSAHPYDVPEILANRVSSDPDYATWVHEQTRP